MGSGNRFHVMLTIRAVEPGPVALVTAKDTPETAGLNATYEQLGNAVGVALVGTIMLVSLSAGLEQGINASDTILPDDKAALTQTV